MALSGLQPSAPRVLSGTGWRLPDGFRAFGPGSYIIPLRWQGTAPAAPVYMPPAAKRHTKWRPQGAFLSPAQRYYITPEGGSPQPACKAKPITGRTLPAQGVSPAAGSTLARESGRQPSGIQPSAAIVALPPQHPAFSTISRAQAAAFWKSSSLGCFSASLRRASLSGVIGCTFSACSLRFPIWKE